MGGASVHRPRCRPVAALALAALAVAYSLSLAVDLPSRRVLSHIYRSHLHLVADSSRQYLPITRVPKLHFLARYLPRGIVRLSGVFGSNHAIVSIIGRAQPSKAGKHKQEQGGRAMGSGGGT